jgi:DNA-directed RNA polymerase specialized sigma24 family protein
VENNCLAVLYEHHKEWIAMVRSFGESNYAEDIVQEMYIRVHKYSDCEKFVSNGEVNKGYVWMILRNSCATFQTQKSKVQKVGEENLTNLIDDCIEIEYYICIDRIYELIAEEIETWHWYDRRVFKIIVYQGVSMRRLSRESNISVDSLFNTMKRCKTRIKNAIEKEALMIKNRDYSNLK